MQKFAARMVTFLPGHIEAGKSTKQACISPSARCGCQTENQKYETNRVWVYRESRQSWVRPTLSKAKTKTCRRSRSSALVSTWESKAATLMRAAGFSFIAFARDECMHVRTAAWDGRGGSASREVSAARRPPAEHIGTYR
eukprot:6179130-Pleurochrysis_carterae.AAC.1